MIQIRAQFDTHQQSVTLDAKGCATFVDALSLATKGIEFQIRDVRRIIHRFYTQGDEVRLIAEQEMSDPIGSETIGRIKTAAEKYRANTRKEK
jgi:hypothetical protein